MPEGENVGLRFVERLEIIGVREQTVEMLSFGEDGLNEVSKELLTKHRPHSPQAKGCGTFGALDGSQPSIEVGSAAVGGTGVCGEQVGSLLLKGGIGMLPLPVEQKRTERRHKEHLVGIDDHAVSLVDALEKMTVQGAGEHAAAMGSVNVQPDLMAVANLCDRDERVECAHWRGAAAGYYRNDGRS